MRSCRDADGAWTTDEITRKYLQRHDIRHDDDDELHEDTTHYCISSNATPIAIRRLRLLTDAVTGAWRREDAANANLEDGRRESVRAKAWALGGSTARRVLREWQRTVAREAAQVSAATTMEGRSARECRARGNGGDNDGGRNARGRRA